MTTSPWRPILAALFGLSAAATATAVAAPAAHATNVAPKIVSAVMVDADKDNKADRVRLTYSEPVSHVLDTSGFPFKVAGYTVTRVAAATNKSVVVVVAEQAAPDITAKPAITYTRTTQQPVRDLEGLQAIAQTYSGTKPLDLDGDGAVSDPLDCAPRDPAIHPGATDLPDLAFVDSNCDGIDGDASTAIFVDANNGNDSYNGTRTAPVKTVIAAFYLVSPTRKQVLVSTVASNSAQVTVPTGADVYGGYDAAGGWTRRDIPTFSNGFSWVVGGTSTLQLLKLGLAGSDPALRVTGSGNATLEDVDLINSISETNSVALFVAATGKVTMRGGSLTSGTAGSTFPTSNGHDGADGAAGGKGQAGSCDTYNGGDGGYGGGWIAGDPGFGGNGGLGGNDSGDDAHGTKGSNGSGGALGGAAGLEGNPGKAGGNGAPGAPGVDGADGRLVLGSFSPNGYAPATSTDGADGTVGGGGAGGGGGGGQVGATVITGVGNGGGGGGQGGQKGTGGEGRRGGYASIAAYVPFGTLVLDGTVVTTGAGGNSGPGGVGGEGGAGGIGGNGGSTCLAEVGRGGNGGAGGAGGDGGNGGAGQGGHSIGVFGGGFAQIQTSGVTFTLGAAGTGPSAIRASVHRP